MRRARFFAPARLDLLSEVAYFSDREPELGARFVAAVEEATARALAILAASSSKTFLSPLCPPQMKTGLSSLQLLITHAAQSIGSLASKTANTAMHQSRQQMIYFFSQKHLAAW